MGNYICKLEKKIIFISPGLNDEDYLCWKRIYTSYLDILANLKFHLITSKILED